MDASKLNRKFVVPGEEIIASLEYLPGKNCFREGDGLVSRVVGIVSLSNRVVSVIPLNVSYIPRAGDMVIGEVMDIQSNGWVLNIAPICNGFLPLAGIREYVDTTRTRLDSIYALGDILYAKVSAVNTLDSVHLTMQDIKTKKLIGGRLVKINTAKIPRLIGKEGSMINMIKDRTNARICIGQNGLVWMQGGDEELVRKTIEMIENGPFAEGLTERVAQLLGGNSAASTKEEKEHEEV